MTTFKTAIITKYCTCGQFIRQYENNDWYHVNTSDPLFADRCEPYDIVKYATPEA